VFFCCFIAVVSHLALQSVFGYKQVKIEIRKNVLIFRLFFLRFIPPIQIDLIRPQSLPLTNISLIPAQELIGLDQTVLTLCSFTIDNTPIANETFSFPSPRSSSSFMERKIGSGLSGSPLGMEGSPLESGFESPTSRKVILDVFYHAWLYQG
jgi:hypothetical protein